jgi:DNA-binding transcriptional MerR regulator
VHQQVFRVQAFADLARVTVRALHHYDRLGLLRPKRSGAGYRLYGLRDLERLEQIVALKLVGLPLKQIKRVLDRDARALPDVLRAQRRALEDKRRRLDHAIDAIADAEAVLQSRRPVDAPVLRRIIDAIETEDLREAMRKYHTDEAWAELENRRREMTSAGRDPAEEGTRKWQALFRDVESALDGDPRGAVAQALLDRWDTLIHEFTRGDRQIAEGVARAWNDRASWPARLKQASTPFDNRRVWEFIERARACRVPGQQFGNPFHVRPAPESVPFFAAFCRSVVGGTMPFSRRYTHIVPYISLPCVARPPTRTPLA